MNSVLVQSTLTDTFIIYNSRGNHAVASTRTHVMERNFKVFLVHVMHAYGALEVRLHSFLTGTIRRCDQLHSSAPTRASKEPHPAPSHRYPFNHRTDGLPTSWTLCTRSKEHSLAPIGYQNPYPTTICV